MNMNKHDTPLMDINHSFNGHGQEPSLKLTWTRTIP